MQEQYLEAPAKRGVQTRLFKGVTNVKTILGLAGTHPEKYVEVLPPHKQRVLVDFNPVHPGIRKNSLIGEFDMLMNQPANYCPVNFVDCDFCRSIINNGADLKYIYEKMKLSTIKNKYIAFTFSLRGVGLDKTMKWLGENFPELNIPVFYSFDFLEQDFGPRKYVKRLHDYWKYYDIYCYRDSGDNMISGIIKLEK